MRGLFRCLLLGYAAWLAVGLGLAGYELFQGYFKYTKELFPTGHVEDLIFLVLAAALLGVWLAGWLGVARTLALFVWITLSSGIIEAYGLGHDLPFGEYRYTGHLGPRLPDGLPLAVPLAWWVVIVPVYLSAQTILALVFSPRGKAPPASNEKGASVSSPWPSRLLALATALGAVGMDLALEPAAKVRGYWFWISSGPWWYDVPALNFCGWAAASFVLALGMQALAGRQLREAFHPGGVSLLVPMLLPATVLAPFWIDLAGLPLAHVWASLLLIIWLSQAILWTRLVPPLWTRVLWAGPPGGVPATSPETNK